MKNFDIAEMRRFAGLTDEDAAILADMKPTLENHADGMVTAFYANLDQHDSLRNLLDAKEGRREKLGVHLRAWILSLATGTYDASYLERRYRIGERHVEVGLDPRWVIGAMSFCRGMVAPMMAEEFSDTAVRLPREMALNKVMDLDLNIMLQSYDDKRMDLFLETTGFSKALFESMIAAD
ncbi:MAG: hypothetical protein KDD89_11210 [Anaerolineales bacterium]|nr:hypothetical protein [Anaerolineales bacterium]